MCTTCGTQAATVGTLCATCDHERWQQERNGNGNGAQPARTAPVLQWNRDAKMYLQIGGTPVLEYMQLADWQQMQEQREASREAAELSAWAGGR
jgi:GH25 family lysozyme M1 (1,4-beta-N-acetylmuramidase)